LRAQPARDSVLFDASSPSALIASFMLQLILRPRSE
jgi:hypothetical protein